MNQNIYTIVSLLSLPYRSEALVGTKNSHFLKKDSEAFRDLMNDVESWFMTQRQGETHQLSLDGLSNLAHWTFFDKWPEPDSSVMTLLSLCRYIGNEFVTHNSSCFTMNTGTKSSLFINPTFDRIIAWRHIGFLCHTDLFLVATLLEKDPRVVTPLIKTILSHDISPACLKPYLDKGIADNHIHSGSFLNPTHIWPSYLQHLISGRVSDFPKIRRPGLLIDGTVIDGTELVFRCLTAAFARIMLEAHLIFKGQIALLEQKVFSVDDDVSRFYHRICKNFQDTMRWGKSWCSESDSKRDLILLRKVICQVGTALFTNRPDQRHFYSAYGEVDFLYRSLAYMLQNEEDDEFALLFWDYIRLKNIFHNFLVQRVPIKGLAYFQKAFFGAGKIFKPLRRYFFTKLDKLIKMQDPVGRLVKLEIRSSPDHVDLPLLFKGAHKAKSCATGIVVHFVKRRDNIRKKITINGQKKEITWYPSAFKNTTRDYLWLKKLIQKKTEMHGTPPPIVGLDVAGGEISMPNWIFLPFFEDFREWWRANINRWRIGYTFHAGEDFLSLFQGLRHIAEVLFFFPWESGDRLGHGLALFFNAAKWANKVVPLKRESYLDDLLCERFLYKTGLLTLPDSSTLVYLDAEITRIAKLIFDDTQCQGVEDIPTLLEMYELKFNPNVLKSIDGLLPECWQPTLQGSHVTPGTALDLLGELVTNPVTMERAQRIDFPSSQQPGHIVIKRLHAIQKLLLDVCRKRNIIIEACPSSNMMIGNMEKMSNLPYLKNIKKRENKICINTDNPLTFSTNLDDELTYTYFGLRDIGCENAEELIDNCRNIGIESSFVPP